MKATAKANPEAFSHDSNHYTVITSCFEQAYPFWGWKKIHLKAEGFTLTVLSPSVKATQTTVQTLSLSKKILFNLSELLVHAFQPS